MTTSNISTPSQSDPSTLKVLAVGVLMTLGYFVAAGLVISLMDTPQPPTPAEIKEQATGQAMFDADMRVAGFPGLALPPPGPDGHIHLTPQGRAEAQADYARLLNFLAAVVMQPDQKAKPISSPVAKPKGVSA